MRYKLRRIGVVSLGLLIGLMSATLTAIFTWPLILFEFMGAGGLGVVSFLFFVVGAMVAGFITGAIVAAIYNLLFTMIGGLTLDLEPLETTER